MIRTCKTFPTRFVEMDQSNHPESCNRTDRAGLTSKDKNSDQLLIYCCLLCSAECLDEVKNILVRDSHLLPLQSTHTYG
ncbi:MAG: hypothetical protein AAF985_16105 [Bacteroidota bacterium]